MRFGGGVATSIEAEERRDPGIVLGTESARGKLAVRHVRFRGGKQGLVARQSATEICGHTGAAGSPLVTCAACFIVFRNSCELFLIWC